MPGYMFAHPVLGLAAVTLILAAFAMKAGQTKYWTLHYATGLAAGATGITAFSVAILAVARRYVDTGGHPNLAPVASAHLVLASLGLIVLTVQVALGLAVHYVLGGAPRFLRFHRRNARLLVFVAIGILLLGLATLSTLMV
jgi:hypothetical protein